MSFEQHAVPVRAICHANEDGARQFANGAVVGVRHRLTDAHMEPLIPNEPHGQAFFNSFSNRHGYSLSDPISLAK
jgi:hypothetical protein